MTPPRPRTPADAVRRAGTPPEPRPGELVRKRGMDFHHLLSAVVGAFAGLVFYTMITPGHLPDEAPVPRRDPALDLFLRELETSLDREGYHHVTGKLYNSRAVTLKRASVVTTFTREGKLVTETFTTVEDVGPREARAFEVRAFAPGATSVDTRVQLAQF